MPEQPELPIGTTPAAKIKERQMAALRMAFSVMVDLEDGTLVEVRGKDMAKFEANLQYAVPNQNWLTRLKHGIANLRRMLEQHERERMVMVSVIEEIMRESRPLSASDIPKDEDHPVRPEAPNRANYAGIHEFNEEDVLMPDNDDPLDEDPVPF